MHLKKRFWHEQYLFTTILLIGPRQKHPKMAQDFQRLWQCWYRTACTDYHRRAWFGFLAALVHIDLHGTRFSPVFFLAAACTHMPDGKPSGKSVLVGMRYKTLPSQDEVLAPCHPQIRKMQQTHNSKKVTLQLFLEWFAWARWGFCQPTPPLCAHHMGSISTKADQFFQEGLLKSINAGLRTDLVARAFTKDTKNFEETSTYQAYQVFQSQWPVYLLSLGWRSLETFEKVTDFQHPKQVTITELPGSYPLQYPKGSMTFLYLPTFDWSFW